MTRHIKNLLLFMLYGTGLLRFFVARQRSKVTILMLHGVTDPKVLLPGNRFAPPYQRSIGIYPVCFRKILPVYFLKQATEMLKGIRPLVSNGLVLTFDDGYRNNLTVALPVLRTVQSTCNNFLCTGNVTKQQPFWFDRLDYAIQSMQNTALNRAKIPELFRTLIFLPEKH